MYKIAPNGEQREDLGLLHYPIIVLRPACRYVEEEEEEKNGSVDFEGGYPPRTLNVLGDMIQSRGKSYGQREGQAFLPGFFLVILSTSMNFYVLMS